MILVPRSSFWLSTRNASRPAGTIQEFGSAHCRENRHVCPNVSRGTYCRPCWLFRVSRQLRRLQSWSTTQGLEHCMDASPDSALANPLCHWFLSNLAASVVRSTNDLQLIYSATWSAVGTPGCWSELNTGCLGIGKAFVEVDISNARIS